MKALLLVFVFAGVLLGTVTGHFFVSSPLARGFVVATNPEPPCGGFNQSTSLRAKFPITGGRINVSIEDDHGTIVFNYGVGQNPTDFNIVEGFLYSVSAGSDSLVLDLSSVASVGTNGTIQVVFEAIIGSGDSETENFYQCVDVTVVAASQPSSTGDASSLHTSFLYQLLALWV